VQKQIANPEYHEDSAIYAYPDFSWVGIDVWQVKSGTIFDNIFISDSATEAEEFANKFLKNRADAEKKMFDKIEEDKKKADEAKAPADSHDDEDDHVHGHDEI